MSAMSVASTSSGAFQKTRINGLKQLIGFSTDLNIPMASEYSLAIGDGGMQLYRGASEDEINNAPSWIKARYAGYRNNTTIQFFVSKPQVSVQVDETWLVVATLGNGRRIAHYYDHDGNRTTFYGDGEYEDFEQTPAEQYRTAKYQGDAEGVGPSAPKTEFTYTAPGNGHLRKVKDSWGRVTTYTWDEGAGVVTSVNELLKNENDDNSWMRQVAYGYDVNGSQRNVNSVIFRTEDGRGNRVGRTYTLNYRYGTNNEILLWKITRPVLAYAESPSLVLTTIYTYDAQNRVVSTSTPGEPDTTFSYGQSSFETGAGGLQVTQTQGDKITVYQFSPEGWLRNRSERNFNPVTNWDYNPSSNVRSGNNTMSWYDANGRITAQSDARGRQVQRTYDQHGNLKTEAIYPNSNNNWAELPPAGYMSISRYTYDNDNQITKITQDAISGQGRSNDEISSDAVFNYGQISKIYTYQKYSAPQVAWAIISTNNFITEKLSVDDSLKRTFQSEIDEYGRITKTSLSIDNKSYKTVDYSYIDGYLANLVYPSSITTPFSDSRTYDREKSVHQYSDQVAAKVVNAAVNGGIRTEYLYDEYGNVVRELMGNSHVYSWNGSTKLTAQSHHWRMYNGFGQPIWESLWEYQPENNAWSQMISRQWMYYNTGELDARWDGSPSHVIDYNYYGSGNDLGRVATVLEGIGTSSAIGVATVHKTSQYGYDAYGRPSTETVDGFTTTTQYSTLDQPAKVTLPDGSSHTFNYYVDGGLINETQVNVDGTSATTYHLRDSLGREYQTETTTAAGSLGKINTYYDAYDRPVKITDNRLTMNGNEAERSTYLKYDTAGNLMQRLDPAMITASGQPYADARRPYQVNNYDKLDRKIGSCQLLTGNAIDPNNMQMPSNANCPWVTTQYDAFDRVIQTNDQDGYATKFAYDNSNNVVQVDKQVWKGNEEAYPWNSGFSWVTTYAAYDAADRPVQQVDGKGNSSKIEYNIFGPVWLTNENGQRLKNMWYTPDGLPQGVAEPAPQDGNSFVTTEYREYDSRQFPARIYTAYMNNGAGAGSGSRTDYVYDYAGRPTQTTLPPDQNGNRAVVSQTYHNNGQPRSLTDANGFTTNFTYDWAGRLIQKDELARAGNATDQNAGLAGGLKSSYIYDNAGNLTKKTERGLITEYKYNTLGKVISESRPRVGDSTATNWKRTTYNLYGLPTAQTSYNYAGNLPADVTDPWDSRFSITAGNATMPWYYARGLPIGEVSWGANTGGEYTKNLFRDGMGRVVLRKFWGNTGIYAEQTDGSGNRLGHGNLWTLQKYDENGNLTSKWDAPGNNDNSAPYDGNLVQNRFDYTYTKTNREASSTRNIAVRVKGANDPRFTELTIQGGSTGLLLTGSQAQTTTSYNARDLISQVTTTEQSPTPNPGPNACSYDCRGQSLPYRHYNFGTPITRTTNYSYYYDGRRFSTDVAGVGTRRVDQYDQLGREINVYDSNGPAKAGKGLAANTATTIVSNYTPGQQVTTYQQNSSNLYSETTQITVGGMTATNAGKSYQYDSTTGMLVKSSTDGANYTTIGYDTYLNQIKLEQSGQTTTQECTENDRGKLFCQTVTSNSYGLVNNTYNDINAQTGYTANDGTTVTYTLDSRGNRLTQTGNHNGDVLPDSGMTKRYTPDDQVMTYNKVGGAGFCGGLFSFCSAAGISSRYNDFRYDPYGQQVVTGTSDVIEGGNNEYKLIRVVRSSIVVNGEVQYIFGRGNNEGNNALYFHWANSLNSGVTDGYTPFGYIVKDQTFTVADGLTDTEQWSGTKPFSAASAGSVQPLDAPVKPLSSTLKINPLDITTPALPKLPDPSKINQGVQQKDAPSIPTPAPSTPSSSAKAQAGQAIQVIPSTNVIDASRTVKILQIDSSGGGGTPSTSSSLTGSSSQQQTGQAGATGGISPTANTTINSTTNYTNPYGSSYGAPSSGSGNGSGDFGVHYPTTPMPNPTVPTATVDDGDPSSPPGGPSFGVSYGNLAQPGGYSPSLARLNPGVVIAGAMGYTHVGDSFGVGTAYQVSLAANAVFNSDMDLSQKQALLGLMGYDYQFSLTAGTTGAGGQNRIVPRFRAPTLQDAADFSSAFGSFISFGLTDKFNQWTGADSVVNRNSNAYRYGTYTAYAYSAADAALALKGLAEGGFNLLKPCLNSFSGETPVLTINGLFPIGALSLGTPVYAYNEQTGQNGYYPITNIFTHGTKDQGVTYLTILDPEQASKSETITTTPEHPFYVKERSDNEARPKPVGHEDLNSNWVGAGHLKIGDKIKQADGTTGVVANVTTIQQTQEMFNLTVSEAHTFYVGTNGWLVHNQSRAVPAGPYLIDTGVLIQAQRGDATALQLLRGNYTTQGVVNEFLNVTTNVQRQQLKAFLNSSGIQVMDAQTAKTLSSSADFQQVFNQLVKAGHSRTDAALAAFSKTSGMTTITTEKRLYNAVTYTYSKSGVSMARLLNGLVQCP